MGGAASSEVVSKIKNDDQQFFEECWNEFSKDQHEVLIINRLVRTIKNRNSSELDDKDPQLEIPLRHWDRYIRKDSDGPKLKKLLMTDAKKHFKKSNDLTMETSNDNEEHTSTHKKEIFGNLLRQSKENLYAFSDLELMNHKLLGLKANKKTLEYYVDNLINVDPMIKKSLRACEKSLSTPKQNDYPDYERRIESGPISDGSKNMLEIFQKEYNLGKSKPLNKSVDDILNGLEKELGSMKEVELQKIGVVVYTATDKVAFDRIVMMVDSIWTEQIKDKEKKQENLLCTLMRITNDKKRIKELKKSGKAFCPIDWDKAWELLKTCFRNDIKRINEELMAMAKKELDGEAASCGNPDFVQPDELFQRMVKCFSTAVEHINRNPLSTFEAFEIIRYAPLN
ncbi:uncharacterized protein LOC141907862 isoform X2 [Tubulanus polymorphus]|uniref:uncharacterized protein LOC141907862 isoform X2 n=1 Tax=Tubulanus polymorphus TaxID=672921 RepID=UPI003DA33617